MNAGEVAELGWQFSGEDSRFDPTDFSTPEGILLRKRLNQAYFVVCSYRFERSGIKAFRALEQEALYTTRFNSGVIANATANTIVFGAPGASLVQIGDAVQIGGQSVEVVSIGGNPVTHTVAPAFGTVPAAGSSYTASQKTLNMLTHFGAEANKVIEIIDLFDLTNRAEVYRATNIDYYDYQSSFIGVPTEYVRAGRDRLILAFSVSGEFTYRCRWAQLPVDLVNTTDELVLPEQYHEAVAKRLAYTLHLVKQDREGARELRVEYENDMRRLQDEYEEFWDTNPGTILREDIRGYRE